MALIQCSEGHFYDEKKYDSCPYCDREKTKNVQKFNDINAEDISNIQYTQMYSDNGSDMDKTIGIYASQKEQRLVTGWLVMIKGKLKGKSYPLYYGKNIVGRSLHMDVSLTEEEMITRENHFSIVFENKRCKFYAVEGTAPVMVNYKMVKGYVNLEDGDIISVADVELIFVPYCRKGRMWNEE